MADSAPRGGRAKEARTTSVKAVLSKLLRAQKERPPPMSTTPALRPTRGTEEGSASANVSTNGSAVRHALRAPSTTPPPSSPPPTRARHARRGCVVSALKHCGRPGSPGDAHTRRALTRAEPTQRHVSRLETCIPEASKQEEARRAASVTPMTRNRTTCGCPPGSRLCAPRLACLRSTRG